MHSIALLNANGLHDVPVVKIAQDLGISTGNLTYHFPLKQDLIAATLDVMSDRLRTALESPQGIRSAGDGAEYLIRIYHTLWNFRFFFNGLTHILSDAETARAYLKLHGWVLETMISDCVVMSALGFFSLPRKPNSFRLLCENTWSMWLNWVRMQHIRTPSALMPDDASVYSCVLQDWALHQPFMRADFAADLLKKSRKLLPGWNKRVRE